MTTLRTVRLVLHPSRGQCAWGLVLRTDDGRTVFDRRLHAGVFAEIGALQGVEDVSSLLRLIADEVDRRHGVGSAAEPPREPRGAVGGGPDHRPGRVCAHSCPLCGEHLDGMPSDD